MAHGPPQPRTNDDKKYPDMTTRYRLYCITKNQTNPAYDGARIGAARTARSLGCDLLNYAPEKPDDPAEQGRLLERVLKDKPDAVLIAPTHSSHLNPLFKEIIKSGIILGFFVSDVSDVSPDIFVTSDNYSLAGAVGTYLIERIGRKGGLVVLDGNPNSITSAPRTQGFLEAAASYPGIRILARESGDYQRDTARRAMTDILRRQPKVEGVLAANDFMAMGVIDAFNASYRSAPIVGVNAMPEAIRAIKDGEMCATVAYDAMHMASVLTAATVKLLRGRTPPSRIELPAEIVDIKNCDAWNLPYAERQLPDWERMI